MGRGVAAVARGALELAPDARTAAIGQVTRWIEQGRLQHAVTATYPLDRIVEAHEAVESGKHIGNVVVTTT